MYFTLISQSAGFTPGKSTIATSRHCLYNSWRAAFAFCHVTVTRIINVFICLYNQRWLFWLIFGCKTTCVRQRCWLLFCCKNRRSRRDPTTIVWRQCNATMTCKYWTAEIDCTRVWHVIGRRGQRHLTLTRVLVVSERVFQCYMYVCVNAYNSYNFVNLSSVAISVKGPRAKHQL